MSGERSLFVDTSVWSLAFRRDAPDDCAEVIVAVPETGHAVFVDDPTTFDRALQGLLDSTVGAKKGSS